MTRAEGVGNEKALEVPLGDKGSFPSSRYQIHKRQLWRQRWRGGQKGQARQD